MGFIFYCSISLVAYLALTAGTGSDLLLWSYEEIGAGVIVSVLFAVTTKRIIPSTIRCELVNPFKWIMATLYMAGPFAISLVIATLEVIFRVFTKRIKPAIVKMETGMKSEVGTYFLANSITLSPGTLTLEMNKENNDLYVHCLNWNGKAGERAEPEKVAPILYYWMKKIYG